MGIVIRKYGSWNKAKINFGFPINKTGYNNITHASRVKKEADLIYDLRTYINEYKRLPWKFTPKGDVRLNNFPHAKATYANRWGSLRKSWAHCGIKRSKNNWLLIS